MALVEINWSNSQSSNTINEVKILWDFEEIAVAKTDSESKKFDEIFPLMCFANKKDDPKELNFNELKSCSKDSNDIKKILSDKYFVITFQELDNNSHNNNGQKHKFQELHSEKPTWKIKLNYENSNTQTSHDAKVLKVFNEKYIPKAKLNANTTTSK